MTFKEWFNNAPHRAKYTDDHPAYLAAREAWDAAHEACAKVCEDNATDLSEGDWDSACINCADHIRARGNQ